MKQATHIFFFLIIATISVAQPASYDIELGQTYSAQVEAQVGLYEDEALNDYVARVGKKLVDQLGDQPFEYTFQVLDSEESNAFALPGGPTYVTRGLLALINDESELACVMAHEIIHVHQRHAVQQMHGNGFLDDILRLPGQVVGVFNSSLGSLLQVPVDLGSGVFQANYSRSHEKEADRYGIQLADAAGYDPYALVPVLERLANETEFLTGLSERRSLVNDHPVTKKRLKYLEKDLRKDGYVAKRHEQGSIEAIDGMIFGHNPAQGVFVDNAFIQPDMMLYHEMPKGWETINSPEAVGAFQNKNEAVVMLSLADTSLTAAQYVDTVASVFSRRPEFIKERGPVSVNGFEGHGILLNATIDGEPMTLKLVWLRFDDALVELAGYGLKRHEKAMTSSLESFRRLSESERNEVTVKRIAFTQAKKGETLTDISDRTQNVIREDVLAILNGIKPSDKFKAGDLVKIVLEYPY